MPAPRLELSNLFVVEVFRYLVEAWIIKVRGNLSRVKLPEVSTTTMLTSDSYSLAAEFTDRVVARGAKWTGRKCFFRTFILASVLRRRGLPVVMNVGLRQTDPRRSRKRLDGHCWLTLADVPFLEREGLVDQYPEFLGAAANGLRFWIGVSPRGNSTPAAAEALLERFTASKLMYEQHAIK